MSAKSEHFQFFGARERAAKNFLQVHIFVLRSSFEFELRHKMCVYDVLISITDYKATVWEARANMQACT